MLQIIPPIFTLYRIPGFVFLWFCFGLQLAKAEPAALRRENIRVTFLNDTVTQTGNSLSFNSVTITNTSAAKQVFGMELRLPEGWSSLLDNRTLYTLEPNGTIQVPIRVAASNTTLSNLKYSITLIINNPGINEKSSFTYFAKVLANSKWRASLASPELMLDRINKETYFEIALRNSGNIAEELNIEYNTSLDLTVPKRNNRVILKPRGDTVLRIGIITEAKYLQEFKPQEIGIRIENKDKTEQRMVQRVYSKNTIFRENPSRWYTAPLSLELVSQNFSNKAQQVYYLNSSGMLDLGDQRSLSFNYRSDNFYTLLAGGGNRYANADFISKKWRFSVGDQTEFSNLLLDGLGARVIYQSGKGYKFNAVGVKSRRGNADQLSIEQEIKTGKTQSLINRTTANLDYITRVNSFSNIAEYELAFGKSSNISLFGGYGFEDINLPWFNTRTNGSTAGLRYNYNTPRFLFRTTDNLSSANFPGLERGVTRSSNEVRLINKSLFIGAMGEYNSRSVSTLDSTRFVYLFAGRTSEYGMRTGYSKGRNNLTLTASIVDQLQDSVTNLPYQSKKLNLSTGLGITKGINLSLSANLAQSYPLGRPEILPVYGLNAFGSLQAKSYGLSFRIDQGPSYYAELLSYQNTGIKTNRFQVSPYIQRSFFNSMLTSRVEVNYMEDLVSNNKNYTARMDMNVDLKKHGLSLRFYGSHDFTNTNNLSSMNLSIKKAFALPLLGLQKYRSLKVVMYKDNNNNSVYDKSDEPVPEANILIGSQYFTTNKQGEAYYKNIKRGDYAIDLGQVQNQKGWIARNGFKQTIALDKSKEFFVPFQISKFLSGRLNIEKDQYSKLEFNPANIRISAINSKGENFTTLTDEKGQFFMNLPADTYMVKINANVFSEEFRILKETFSVDLTVKNAETLVFEIREKKRQINIRK